MYAFVDEVGTEDEAEWVADAVAKCCCKGAGGFEGDPVACLKRSYFSCIINVYIEWRICRIYRECVAMKVGRDRGIEVTLRDNRSSSDTMT